MSQAADLKEKYGDHGPQGLLPPDMLLEKLRRPWRHLLIAAAVAYQFAKVGNDEAAQKLVVDLDNDKLLGTYIDCMGTSPGQDLLVHVPY